MADMPAWTKVAAPCLSVPPTSWALSVSSRPTGRAASELALACSSVSPSGAVPLVGSGLNDSCTVFSVCGNSGRATCQLGERGGSRFGRVGRSEWWVG